MIHFETIKPERTSLTDFGSEEIKNTDAASSKKEHISAQYVDIQKELKDSSEELADILSTFGKFGKSVKTRSKGIDDGDYLSSVLEEEVDEKMEMLIKYVSHLKGDSEHIISYARRFFHNDIDLILVLREMLLSKKLSIIQKKKIQEAIIELERFADCDKVRSGINIGKVAKFYNKGTNLLSAMELRECYLQFLEFDLPISFIYQYWIDNYGVENRYRLLAFIMSALIADIKANEPGIHCAEFGPLATSILNVRILQTLDEKLISNITRLVFYKQIRDNIELVPEGQIIKLYMSGVLNNEFDENLKIFTKHYLSFLLLRQKGTVFQILKNIYNLTPGVIFPDKTYQQDTLDCLTLILNSLYNKERKVGIFSEYYNN
ncbi:type III secretion system gatekeeper subunit SctW [Salmonella enterica]|nr:type III secretion system gatekeeper subunit SctW [Salmonella enterica]